MIVQLARLVGCVPALESHRKVLWQFSRTVGLKPACLDHAAAERSGCLLVLAGEVVFALRFTDFLKRLKRLSAGVQSLARAT